MFLIIKDPKQQLKAYRAFMAEDESESFLEKMNLKKLPSVLGEHAFVRSIKDKFFEGKRHIEVPESKRLAPSADRILYNVCEHYGIEASQLLPTRRGMINEARSLAIYLFRYLRGMSLNDIGEAFDIGSYSTVSSIIERFKVRMHADRKLSRKVEKLKTALMRQGQTRPLTHPTPDPPLKVDTGSTTLFNAGKI